MRRLYILSDMELLHRDGRLPRFLFRKFVAQRRKYDADDTTPEWTSLTDLRATASALCPGKRGALLGHIGRRSARDWLDRGWGMLYAVGYDRDVLFCTSRGTVVGCGSLC